MRRQSVVCLILALSAFAAHAQSSSDDVLAAIAADAGAPPSTEPIAPAPAVGPPSSTPVAPAPAPTATPPPQVPIPAVEPSATTHTDANAEALEAVNTCNIGHGDHWQQQAGVTLAQCASALETSGEPYDANGLRHAYWQGTYLSVSSDAIYQSQDGSTWTKLRERSAE